VLIVGFFDEALDKAKEVLDCAEKKTTEVVNTSKIRFNAASLNSQISKDYETLGNIYYQLVENGLEPAEDSKEIISQLVEKNERLKILKKQTAESKGNVVCPKCGFVNDVAASFCSACGEKLK